MFNKLLLTDTSGNKSSTLTAFVVGFLIVNLKLLVSGMTVAGFAMSPFTGSEYSLAVAALGAIYVLRRSTGDNSKVKKK